MKAYSVNPDVELGKILFSLLRSIEEGLSDKGLLDEGLTFLPLFCKIGERTLGLRMCDAGREHFVKRLSNEDILRKLIFKH